MPASRIPGSPSPQLPRRQGTNRVEFHRLVGGLGQSLPQGRQFFRIVGIFQVDLFHGAAETGTRVEPNIAVLRASLRRRWHRTPSPRIGGILPLRSDSQPRQVLPWGRLRAPRAFLLFAFGGRLLFCRLLLSRFLLLGLLGRFFFLGLPVGVSSFGLKSAASRLLFRTLKGSSVPGSSVVAGLAFAVWLLCSLGFDWKRTFDFQLTISGLRFREGVGRVEIISSSLALSFSWQRCRWPWAYPLFFMPRSRRIIPQLAGLARLLFPSPGSAAAAPRDSLPCSLRLHGTSAAEPTSSSCALAIVSDCQGELDEVGSAAEVP